MIAEWCSNFQYCDVPQDCFVNFVYTCFEMRTVELLTTGSRRYILIREVSLFQRLICTQKELS